MKSRGRKAIEQDVPEKDAPGKKWLEKGIDEQRELSEYLERNEGSKGKEGSGFNDH